MHHFEYNNGILCAEDIPIDDIARDVGTPFYCYSSATLERHFRVFAQAFKRPGALIAYSVKANSNLSVVRTLAKAGAGADVVSRGELRRALTAGVAANRIVFSGVGKTREEMAEALEVGIYQFNVESEPELEALSQVSQAMNKMAPITLRINPDVDAGTHEKITTGRAENKFGIAWGKAREIYRDAASLPGLKIVGVDVHIGSQITALDPFEQAFKKVSGLVKDLRADGHDIQRLDLGGGLGIPYASKGKIPPHPDQYASMIERVTDGLDVQLIFEPGRLIVGNAGLLVSRVIYIKHGENRHFVILDAAMNDLIRPALYDAHHDILPIVEPAQNAVQMPFDVVGPVCETGDRFAQNCNLPPLRSGDLVAIMSTGAYGAVQSCEYNTRPLIPEVMVRGGQMAVIRRRPSYEDMLASEPIADWLN